METLSEPIRAGLSKEKREELEEWFSSPEGKEDILKISKELRVIISEMKKAREIPFHILHTPMDF